MSVFSRLFPLDLKICSYNGSAPGVVPLGQEGPVLAPGAGSDCLGDASPIAPRLEDAHILSEDPLEPFESLARGREAAGGGGAGIGAAAGRMGSCPATAGMSIACAAPCRGKRRPAPLGPLRATAVAMAEAFCSGLGGQAALGRRWRAGAGPRPCRVPPAPASSALPSFPSFPAP